MTKAYKDTFEDALARLMLEYEDEDPATLIEALFDAGIKLFSSSDNLTIDYSITNYEEKH